MVHLFRLREENETMMAVNEPITICCKTRGLTHPANRMEQLCLNRFIESEAMGLVSQSMTENTSDIRLPKPIQFLVR